MHLSGKVNKRKSFQEFQPSLQFLSLSPSKNRVFGWVKPMSAIWAARRPAKEKSPEKPVPVGEGTLQLFKVPAYLSHNYGPWGGAY